MAYFKSSPNNKFAPSTVVSNASMNMPYGQVYENLNYKMGMGTISESDRKWMDCRKKFINNNKKAFEELQIQVGNLIEAGKIAPSYANNLDEICTKDELKSMQDEVNTESVAKSEENDIKVGPVVKPKKNKIKAKETDINVGPVVKPKKNKTKMITDEEKAKKEKIEKAKEEKKTAKKNFNEAKKNYEDNPSNDEIREILLNTENKFIEANEAYNELVGTFSDKVYDKVDKEIEERKEKTITKEAALKDDVKKLKDANKILLQNVPETKVINRLAELKIEKIEKVKGKQKKTLTAKEKKERSETRKNNKAEKEKINEDVRIGVEVAKELAVKDGLLIKTEKGKYIPNINKNDIGTLKKVKDGKKFFTISGHVKEDITTVEKNGKIKYMLKRNKDRAAQNKWSESLKLLNGNNVKMVGPVKFKNEYAKALENEKPKLIENLQNYITVMGDYIAKLADSDNTKQTKQAKLDEAKALLETYSTQQITAQDAQRLSVMDRDYRQSFQAAYQQKPFKADRYRLGSSDMHDWPSAPGSSVSSNRDSWYAEWNANRSY